MGESGSTSSLWILSSSYLVHGAVYSAVTRQSVGYLSRLSLSAVSLGGVVYITRLDQTGLDETGLDLIRLEWTGLD